MKVSTSFLEHPLTLSATIIGREISLLCIGGSKPHLGGAAMAVPYERTSGIGTAVSILSAPGHQDSVLANDLARRFCKIFNRTVFVLCGIHYDNLSSQELSALRGKVFSLCEELEALIK
jgi:hypothetical protein